MLWPASVVPADASVVARAIGGIFDQTVLSRHASRPLRVADTWIAWASKWTQSFGACYYAELLRACVDEGDAPEDSEVQVVSQQSEPKPLVFASLCQCSAAASVDPSSPLTDPFLSSRCPSQAKRTRSDWNR